MMGFIDHNRCSNVSTAMAHQGLEELSDAKIWPEYQHRGHNDQERDDNNGDIPSQICICTGEADGTPGG
jgi:hypothetical protein